MSISIQTNVNAMVAQENLRANTDFQSRTIERLTSGYRINSSADDAPRRSLLVRACGCSSSRKIGLEK